MASNDSNQSRRALLLLNVGTPDQPETLSVKSYLRQFLMDPYVIDIPFLFRWLLVHGAVLPKRPALSAAAYQKIWTDRGSPLSFHLFDLTKEVEKRLGADWVVQSAMRYGSPTIESAFQVFKDRGVQELLVFPLYPQYSLAATESAIQECARISKKLHFPVKMTAIEQFFEHEAFIGAFLDVFRKSVAGYSYDHVLFSFHGLPERQIKKLALPGSPCLHQEHSCEQVTELNPSCYRAQCFTTARLIARGLQLNPDQYTVCFQSRLGRTPWIKPYTDHLYRELPKRGVKRLAVVCPAFVSDCLETLEEVQIRGREEFIQNGGEDLRLVSSLNSNEKWVQAVCQLALHPEQVSTRRFR